MKRYFFISLLFFCGLLAQENHKHNVMTESRNFPLTQHSSSKEQNREAGGFRKRVARKGLKRLPYSWKNPKIPPSPQPPLTGKQMGVLQTPGIKPLGYTMDGKVKVFRLYAQPIEQYITDGKKAEYDKLIPKKNKFPHHAHGNIV